MPCAAPSRIISRNFLRPLTRLPQTADQRCKLLRLQELLSFGKIGGCQCQSSRGFATKSKSKSKRKRSSSSSKAKKTFQKQQTKPTSKKEKGKQILKLPKKKDSVFDAPSTPNFIPPALLLPTASPFAYVARAAFVKMDGHDDNNHEEEDPRKLAKFLFADLLEDPNTINGNNNKPFQGMTFDYVAPHVFGHELPHSKANTPEVAFLGRSNVGKSSLINALMNKDLARCSKHPGRTQQPYYYGLLPSTQTQFKSEKERLAACQGFLVDLPGYGYASAPSKEVDAWQRHTQEFLVAQKERGSLQRLFLLLDARRSLSDNKAAQLDFTVMRWMDDHAIPYTVVITKADTVAKPQVIKVTNQACMRYQQQHQEEIEQVMYDNVSPDEIEAAGWQSPVVHITSARKGEGLLELRSAVEAEFLSANE